jgi:hypothetical protein
MPGIAANRAIVVAKNNIFRPLASKTGVKRYGRARKVAVWYGLLWGHVLILG